MKWSLLQIKNVIFLSASSQQQQQPFYVSRPSFSSSQSNSFDLNSKISPNVLLVIIIIAIVVFVSGLLHLLIRFLFRPRIRRPEGSDSATTALQGQLQQLFNLHDAGVDQSFIDTLPVFHYKAIIGLKDPFDCAVCLCEFEAEDTLRLLPKCSHAFHMDCIDTWLLTHSTCPLCRANLLHDFSTSCSPIVLVLESGSDSSREIAIDNNSGNAIAADAIGRTNSNLGFQEKSDLGSTRFEIGQKSGDFSRKEELKTDPDGKVVPVKLGKIKNIESSGEGSSICSSNNNNEKNADARRCYSMGHFEYVMNEDTLLLVPITMEKSQATKKKPLLPLGPGHRAVKSVCIGGESRREFVLESAKIIEEPKVDDRNIGNTSHGKSIMGKSQKESFSISKVWLRGKTKEGHTDGASERRAFSFRFPVNRSVVGGSVAAVDDDDVGGGDLQTKTPSFGRRTMFWPVWRQNKVANTSSLANNV